MPWVVYPGVIACAVVIACWMYKKICKKGENAGEGSGLQPAGDDRILRGIVKEIVWDDASGFSIITVRDSEGSLRSGFSKVPASPLLVMYPVGKHAEIPVVNRMAKK